MLTGKVFSSHEISLIHRLIKQYNVFIKNNMILVLVWTILSSLVLLFLIYVFFLSFLFQFFNLFYFLQHFKFQKFILLVFLIMFIYHSILLLFFYHLIYLYDRMSLSEASYTYPRYCTLFRQACIDYNLYFVQMTVGYVTFTVTYASFILMYTNL